MNKSFYGVSKRDHREYSDGTDRSGGGDRKRKWNGWDSDGNEENAQSPPLVVEIMRLPLNMTEADVLDVFATFGPVAYVFVVPNTGVGFVEFEDEQSARSCVSFAQNNPVMVSGNSVTISFATIKMIERNGLESRDPSPVIVMTISNVQRHRITVPVIESIMRGYGQIMRIAIGRDRDIHALVEFINIESAKQAKHDLNGADVYPGCCSLKIEYAKMQYLEIRKNDDYQRDFTVHGLPLQQEPPIWAGPPGGFQGHVAVFPYFQNNLNFPAEHSQQQHGGNNYLMDGGYGEMASDQQNHGQEHRYDRESRPRQHKDNRGEVKQEAEQDEETSEDDYGSVIEVSGLNRAKINCDGLFSLLCQYGNVTKVLFIRNKDDGALVQMGNPEHARSAVEKLNGFPLFGNTLTLEMTKRNHVHDVPNPIALRDGTPSFKNYEDSRNHRFTEPQMAAKNRRFGPCKIIRFFNAPPTLTEKRIRDLMLNKADLDPVTVRLFPSKLLPGRSMTGICEFRTVEEAMNAVAKCCHAPLESPFGKKPFIIKFAFAFIRDNSPVTPVIHG